METPRETPRGTPRETYTGTPTGTAAGVPTETIAYYEYEEAPHLKRVSWPAIFAGTLIMLVTLMLLSLLGVGIGLASINPVEEAQPLSGIGTGALIWWVLSNLIAIFAGAYAAANLTNITFKMTGIYHGILTWSLYALISFWLMTTAVGGVISGVGSVVSGSLSALGSGFSEIASMAQGQQINEERINKLIQEALQRDQQQVGDTVEFDIDVMAVVREVFFVNGQLQTDVNREELEQSIARNSTLTQQDVERAAEVIMEEYQRLEQQWQQLKQQAEQTAQDASDAAGKAGIWGFVALLLGVITAGLGGMAGKPDPAEVRGRRKVV